MSVASSWNLDIKDISILLTVVLELLHGIKSVEGGGYELSLSAAVPGDRKPGMKTSSYSCCDQSPKLSLKAFLYTEIQTRLSKIDFSFPFVTFWYFFCKKRKKQS